MRHVTKSIIMAMDLKLAVYKFNACACFVEYELMPRICPLKRKKNSNKSVEKLAANVEWLIVCKERILQLDPTFDDKGVVDRFRSYVESLGKTLIIP